MVGDTIYRPEGLVAYRGRTVSGPICSLVHVPLDGTERTGGAGGRFICLGWGAVWALVRGNNPASRTLMLVVLLGEITVQKTICETLRHKTLPSSLRVTCSVWTDG